MTVEYRRNPATGAKERVTRRFRREVRAVPSCPAVEERAQWRRFGAAAVSNEGASLVSPEDVVIERPGNDSAQRTSELEKLVEKGGSVAKCRTCGGDHWTLSCPLKDTARGKAVLAGENTTNLPSLQGPSSGGMGGGGGAAQDGKYMTPAQRRAQAGGLGGSADSGRPLEVPAEELRDLKISDIDPGMTQDDLDALVRRYGAVLKCKLLTYPPEEAMMMGKLHKGIAFVEFSTHRDAERAKNELNGHLWGHLAMQVAWAQPRRATDAGREGLAGNRFVSGYGKTLVQNK